MHLLNEHCATSELTALYFMYSHFLCNCFKFLFKSISISFKSPCFYYFKFLVFIADYFTFFYVKHFELPLCMTCAISINLPCLATKQAKGDSGKEPKLQQVTSGYQQVTQME